MKYDLPYYKYDFSIRDRMHDIFIIVLLVVVHIYICAPLWFPYLIHETPSVSFYEYFFSNSDGRFAVGFFCCALATIGFFIEFIKKCSFRYKAICIQLKRELVTLTSAGSKETIDILFKNIRKLFVSKEHAPLNKVDSGLIIITTRAKKRIQSIYF